MASFSAEWLTLREPADHRARSARVTRAVADALPRDRPIDILDLAAGAGSNARYLAAYIRSPQAWLLVDHDPVLLDMARERSATPVATRVADLSRLEHDDALDALFRGRDLVTASALLDLVSDGWLRQLADCCQAAHASVLFALSYDGRLDCSPPDPDDERVRDLVNRHQRTDKGFGPAIGPDAGARAATWFASRDYCVVRDRSDWVLGASEAELQRQLIGGWAEAAIEMAAGEAGLIGAWRGRRLAHVLEGRSQLVVGHEDLAAFLV